MLASQIKAPSCFIPGDTVVDSGRVLRRPVADWSSHLLANLRWYAEHEPVPETIERACGALNNAALLFAHAGMSDVAEKICWSQLGWLEEFRTIVPECELAVLAIHPWVNLGRLSRRSGDGRRALGYFLALDTSRPQLMVRFGRWENRVSDCFREVAEPLWIYESLRTLLQSGDLDRAVDFANSLKSDLLRNSSMLKTELLMHLFLQRGEPYRLFPLINEMPWPEDRFGVLVKHFYSAVALGAAVDSELCTRAIGCALPHLANWLTRQDLDSRDLRLAIEVCRLAAHAGRPDLMAEMASGASAAILHTQDVPLARQLLLLNALPAGKLAALEKLVAYSGYKMSGNKPMRLEVAEALFELQDLISALVQAPLRNRAQEPVAAGVV
jgi:hypothetical protein